MHRIASWLVVVASSFCSLHGRICRIGVMAARLALTQEAVDRNHDPVPSVLLTLA